MQCQVIKQANLHESEEDYQVVTLLSSATATAQRISAQYDQTGTEWGKTSLLFILQMIALPEVEWFTIIQPHELRDGIQY